LQGLDKGKRNAKETQESKISGFSNLPVVSNLLCIFLIHLSRLFTTTLSNNHRFLLSYLLHQRILDRYLDFGSLLVELLHRHAAHVTHDPRRAGFLQLLHCMRGCQCDYLVARRYTGTHTRGSILEHQNIVVAVSHIQSLRA
jgi:hypothetical protein